MYFLDVVNKGPLPALEKMLAFTQARHRVLTENIANLDTPSYQVQHLDPKAFQQTLREALDRREKTGAQDLELRSSGQFSQDGAGHLVVTPTVEPAENVLFHDHTNARIERQMADLAENAMTHQVMTELLRNRFQDLLKAISGKVA
jgi:flagellar basal-body rod protein FlgB